MDRKGVFFSVLFGALAWVLLLAGCGEHEKAAGIGTQVYSLSADGRALVGHARGGAGAETGRVAVPDGSVWSMAGTGEADLVWVHAPGQTLLVDTRRWQVLTRWSRVGVNDAPIVARHEVD